jgi:hypothetical protein
MKFIATVIFGLISCSVAFVAQIPSIRTTKNEYRAGNVPTPHGTPAIEIVGVPWSSESKGRTRPRNLWEGARRSVAAGVPGPYYFAAADDASLIRNIDSVVSASHELNEGVCGPDVKLSCLIHREGGSSDTLSFGRFSRMQYNSSIFPTDLSLLQRIIQYILPAQREQVLREP